MQGSARSSACIQHSGRTLRGHGARPAKAPPDLARARCAGRALRAPRRRAASALQTRIERPSNMSPAQAREAAPPPAPSLPEIGWRFRNRPLKMPRAFCEAGVFSGRLMGGNAAERPHVRSIDAAPTRTRRPPRERPEPERRGHHGKGTQNAPRTRRHRRRRRSGRIRPVGAGHAARRAVGRRRGGEGDRDERRPRHERPEGPGEGHPGGEPGRHRPSHRAFGRRVRRRHRRARHRQLEGRPAARRRAARRHLRRSLRRRRGRRHHLRRSRLRHRGGLRPNGHVPGARERGKPTSPYLASAQ